MKNPIPACIVAPFFFMAWCGLAYWRLGTVDNSTLYKVAGITVVLWSLAAYAIFWKRKTISERVHIDVKPNVIEVADGERFTAQFSTGGRFLSSPEQFSSALRDAANRKSHMANRSVAHRESAHVRLWPGELGISELELDAFTQLLEIEFVDPTIEVIDPAIAECDRQTAIRV
ncbi:hypothetical protein ABH908_000142 [Pseudomonas frederiksbergensis]|uniref:hypothetical protein n=1 Tax=Pseudomonas TaxID=286 RepID=UPI003D1A9C2F